MAQRDFERDDRPTAEELRSLLDYDPATGIFRWRRSAGTSAAGDLAGCVRGRYWIIGIRGRRYRAHRLAWVYVYGVWPELEIDHRDTFTLNNAIANLRQATRLQNTHNSKPHRANKIGLKGVTASRGKFHAKIRANFQTIYLGAFDTAEAAHAAYRTAAEQHFGEFARAA